ncbi:hypothetical protein BC832DRAFT_623366 [Gaertneriomyces semiglobifer]|nr:hypothetical protein BC832DRAFT_623366 [Gaertneriomyces semiglobifer]
MSSLSSAALKLAAAVDALFDRDQNPSVTKTTGMTSLTNLVVLGGSIIHLRFHHLQGGRLLDFDIDYNNLDYWTSTSTTSTTGLQQPQQPRLLHFDYIDYNNLDYWTSTTSTTTTSTTGLRQHRLRQPRLLDFDSSNLDIRS